MLSLKIAWRNLWRHKGKSLVIGVIMFLGAFLMTVGNAVIEGARDGMAENMVNRFTGHLMLKADKEKKDKVLFGTPSSLKVIPDYPGVKGMLEEQDFIESFVPMTRGMAMILNPDGDSDETFIIGVNFDDYQRTFLNNVIPLEGKLLSNGDRGILITEYTREKLFDRNTFWLTPENMQMEDTLLLAEDASPAAQEIDSPEIVADAREKYEEGKLKSRSDMIILGFSSSSLGSDIRVPVKGIMKFGSMNKIWRDVTFMDIESYRESFGHISAADNAVELSEQQQTIMENDSMDDLFGEGDVVQETELRDEAYDLEAMQQQTQREHVDVDTDLGAYNLVAVKLQPGLDILEAQTRLQALADEAGARVKVLTWEEAVGEVAQFATITQGALFIFVMFIFFVAIIVIMNTLSMAALERISEIGMMRAIGAQKAFVSKMFLSETFSLAFIFGGIGMLSGVVFSLILASMNIPVTSNDFLSLLFGGDTFNPIVKGAGLVSGVIQLTLVTLLAVIYPLLIARKITPLEAISRD